MIDPGLWGILLPAAVLALGLGWLIGRRAATAQAQELMLAQERYQALQDRFDELQDERMQGQQKLDQQQTLLIKLTARLKDAEATLRSERLAPPRSCNCNRRQSSASASSSRTSPTGSSSKTPATSAN
ncbi:hypothetical protein A6767_00250 [Aeromonas veronii]|nr:hypothetical protein A6767_00250 [Aeromonas veronii]